MKYGDRVKWVSCTGKERTGTFIIHFKSRPGFVLILGNDGQQHVMGEEKPELSQ